MNQLIFVSNKVTPDKIHYAHHTHPSTIFRPSKELSLYNNKDNDKDDYKFRENKP
jgi:hypothetical protein